MRKRLIEKFTKSKEGTLGYTLTELLVVIAIIAILVAIAIPSIIAISRALKFKRVNDHAKSIFLAAQQNLTEMRSDGGLKPLQSAEGAGMIPAAATSFPGEFRTEYVYTTTGTAAFELILPAGSVDGTVRAEQIIIEYNPITGNVYSVFYCEDDDQNIATAYTASDLPREDKSARKDMMLGYYDGSGLNSSQIELEEIKASVEFINGEEGVVRVSVPVPDDFFSNLNEYVEAMSITLGINGEGPAQETATAAETGAEETGESEYDIEIPIKKVGTGLDNDTCYVEYGNTIVVEFPIDSLANNLSFANYASGTQKTEDENGQVVPGQPLTTLANESSFAILPGENITIEAVVEVDTEVKVEVEKGILSGVNPMFEYLQPSGDGEDSYVLAVSNGRNMQNLNALSPYIAKRVSAVVFTSDIYWNDTVSYYNDKYDLDKTDAEGYKNAAAEAPARALPYFVPIHSEHLFGTAKFIYPTPAWWNNLIGQLPGGIIKDIFTAIFKPDVRVPTLTDELDGRIDSETGKEIAQGHAAISGKKTEDDSGIRVYNLNIDSTKYDLGKNFYAGTADANIDRFTGLFGYVNTSIDNIHIVNPIIKGYNFVGSNNPATGALVGAAGYNTYISNCSVYIDKNDPTYSRAKMTGQTGYSKDVAQNWYGVSGEGAVGGLVGYAKSHLNVTGELRADKDVLAFYNSFAAVNVSGNMREEKKRGHDGVIFDNSYYGYADKDYGYSNGVGGFIGNSQLTNFYNCYASGTVIATNTNAADTFGTKTGGIFNSMLQIFGIKLEFQYGGRESAGAGGFVGTSHGTRYTNCFATGTVTATGSSTSLGAGGFVGIMCIDETFAYGNQTDGNVTNAKIAQRTVFTNCYSVGSVTIGGAVSESFSGANCRIAFDLEEFATAQVADYYRLLAQKGRVPTYEDFYIFKDTYYLSNYYLDNQETNSNNCATPTSYPTLQNLPGNHQSQIWRNEQIEIIKKLRLYKALGIFDRTYEDVYFDRNANLEGLYHQAYAKGFASGWEAATAATTHGYDLSGTYPFSKIAGLDYYGDWPAKALDLGVAYYESYGESDTVYLHFDRESTSELQHTADTIVTKDGYAVLSSSNTAMTISVTGVTENYASGQTSGGDTLGNKRYHIYILSNNQMKAAQDYVRTTGQYYVPITVGQDGKTRTYYFNPNVALSQVNGSDNHSYAGEGATCSSCGQANTHANHMPASKEMLIRSARQFALIDDMGSFLAKDYRYIQQMNIDASTYRWANGESEEVDSIGTAEKPFDASYSALYTDSTTGQRSRYTLKGFQPVEAGLFGVIGENGCVENVIVDCTSVDISSKDTDDVAILAGRNEGTIANVDLSVSGNVIIQGKENVGLLAGYTSGTIRNCEVVVEQTAASVELTAANAGGLIGCAEGTENEMTVVANSILDISPKLIMKSTGNAGGLIGKAKYLNLAVTEPVVTLKNNLTADTSAYAGGLAGWMEDSEVKITDKEKVSTVTFKALSAAKGTAAGFLGGGKNVAANGVDVTAGTVSGNIAAGFLGTGTNVDAAYCDVVITNGIQGKAKAAGVAGTIGAQSVFEYVTVNLGTKVEATEGNAAGYAVELAAETDVMNGSVTLNNTTISAPKGKAAGYACSAAGYVGSSNGSSVPSSVVRKDGKNTISGANAAGFACEITGQVSGAFVTPALDSSKYLGNSNENLVVNGTSSAAGFALTVGEDATVTNCYALDKITGGSVTGFVGTNKGTITGCMANVTIDGGYAFVEKNEGTVSRCYGWYGDDKAETATVATVNGKCFSAYFADLNPADKEGKIVTLYAADGTEKIITATELQGAAEMLAGSNYKWYTTGYNSYPYTEKPQNMPNYLYPMLRDHYGDWVMPPQYAYGVAYYEIYAAPTAAAETTEGETTQPAAKASIKLHMVDLSDSSVTEEGANNKSANYTDTFNNDGIIVKTGYAVFSKSGVNILSSFAGGKIADLSYTMQLNDSKSVTYDFYELKSDSAKDGIVSIGATAVSQNKAEVHTWFADAINANGTYQVRTPEQLANVAQTAAASFNFSQTHDIAVTDFTTVEKLSGNYAGNGMKLSATGQTKTWMSTVAGTVQNLNLEIPNGVNAPVFGTVSQGANVTLSGLKIDAVDAEGALANAVSGTMTVPAISTPAVNGMLFGDSDGTINTDAITVGTTDTDGKRIPGAVAQLFGDVANVTVNGAIETGTVSGKLFGDVSGTVSTGAINVTGTAAQVFGDVTGGSLTVTSINTNGNAVSGNVFGNVSAPVTVANGITTVNTSASGTVSGNVFGDINMEAGEAVQVGGITVGNVTNTLVKSITTAAKTDTAAAGSVSLGAVSTQAIGTPAQGETAAKPVDLFGTISGGGTVTTGAITAGDVTGNVFGTVGGTVTTGAINVASLNGKLATTVGGTLQGSAAGTAVNIGENGTADLTQDLVGTVSGSLKNYAVKAADVSASVVGTLGENGAVTFVSITADSAGNAPVLVKSNGGNIVSCTVEVASVEATGAAAPYGVMADQVKADKKIENSFVKVGTLTIDGNTAQFGALVGTNAGTLTGNTVDSNEADNSLALNVTGVNGKEPVIGGLVGTNASTGTVSGGTVDVAITYTQSNTTDDQGNVTATDKGATIGGLVGENSGTIGVKDTVTNVKGAVNLTKKNDGQSRAYIIGGAVGNAQSGVTNITANVQVDAEWAGAPNKEGSATFGSSGITNNGPVGMFVGFAGGVTFKDCHSTAENGTYQFVGEATLVDLTETNGLWYSTTKSETALTAYSDDDRVSDTSYNAKAGIVTALMNANATNCKKVTTEFDNCTFLMGTDKIMQTYGVRDYFYIQEAPTKENAYSIAENAVAPTISGPTSKTYYTSDFTSGAEPTPTQYYFLLGDQYYPVSVQYNETTTGSGWNQTTTRKFRLVDTNSGKELVSGEAQWNYNIFDSKFYYKFDGLYTFATPELNSTYVAVKENGKMMDGTWTEFEKKNFDQKDDEYACLWTVSEGNIVNVETVGTSYAITARMSTGTSPVMEYTASNTTFNLYPVTITPNASAYDVLTFTYQNNAEYQRQFVTSSPAKSGGEG